MGQLFGNLIRYGGEQSALGHLAHYPPASGQDDATNQYVTGKKIFLSKIFAWRSFLQLLDDDRGSPQYDDNGEDNLSSGTMTSGGRSPIDGNMGFGVGGPTSNVSSSTHPGAGGGGRSSSFGGKKRARNQQSCASAEEVIDPNETPEERDRREKDRRQANNARER